MRSGTRDERSGRRRRSGRGVGIAVLVLGLVVASAVVLVREAGDFLVEEDPLAPAELGVVLSGEPTTRVLAARDLYRAGWIKTILIVPEPPRRPIEELVRLGLADPNAPPMAERILRASNVPPRDVRFLPHPIDGTIHEAVAVKAFLGAGAPRRLLVITSRLSSRRACLIMRRVLRGIDVVCAPTHYDHAPPHQWWRQPRDALYVVTEYQKMVVNLAALAIRRPGG